MRSPCSFTGVVLALALSATGVSSQPPKKDPPPPKLNLQKITSAETALTRAGCQFVREKEKGHALLGHTRLVNFPDATTTDTLRRLVPYLKSLPALTGIDLGGTKVTDAALTDLAALADLEALYLDGTAVTDAGLKPLAGLKHLYWLNLDGTKVTGKGLETVGKMGGLQHLSLRGLTGVTNDDLAAIAPLEMMRSLTLPAGFRGSITEDGLKHISGMRALTSLTLTMAVGDAGAKHLGKLISLEHLNLGGSTDLTDAGLQSLTGCVGLKSLTLHGCKKVTAVGVTGFEEMTALETLSLRASGVTDEGVKAFAKCPKLARLDLAGTKVMGVSGVSEMKALVRLDLTNTEVTDAGLKEIARCPSVESLTIGNGKITDDGLAALAPLTSLKFLLVDNTPVTNAGLAKLEVLKDLKTIYAVETKVTQVGAKHYTTAVPNSVVVLKYETERGPVVRNPEPAARPLRAPPTVGSGKK